jgi:hypothetical protein
MERIAAPVAWRHLADDLERAGERHVFGHSEPYGADAEAVDLVLSQQRETRLARSVDPCGADIHAKYLSAHGGIAAVVQFKRIAIALDEAREAADAFGPVTPSTTPPIVPSVRSTGAKICAPVAADSAAARLSSTIWINRIIPLLHFFL